MLKLAGIDDPKLDSTTYHPSSSSHSLPRRVVCHPGHPASTIMGGLVLWLQCARFVYFYCRYLLVSSLFRFRLRLMPYVSEPVSAVVSVTAITGFQLRRHFRLRPKPEKNWFRSVSRVRITQERSFDICSLSREPAKQPDNASIDRPIRYHNLALILLFSDSRVFIDST